MNKLSKILVGLTAVLVLGVRAMAQDDLLTNTNYATAPGWHIAYPPFVAPTEVAVTVEDGDVLALVNERTVLTASGSANGYTNTITLAQPYRVAGQFYIRIDPASSNVVKIADAATVVLGADVVLSDNDTLVLDVIATNKAVLLTSSAVAPVSAATLASTESAQLSNITNLIAVAKTAAISSATNLSWIATTNAIYTHANP